MSASTAVAGQLGAYGRLLRIRDYRLLWAAQFVSTFGDRITQIALATLVFQVTGSELGIGVVLSLSMLPHAAFGFVAGAAADRVSRKTLLIGTDLARAAIVLTLAFWAGVPLNVIYLLTALHATATTFFAPARYAVLPDLVPRGELLDANTLDETTQGALDPVAYLTGGALIAIVGVHSGFAIDGLTFMLSALFIALTTKRTAAVWRAGAASGSMRLRDLTEGVHALLAHPLLRANLWLMVFAALIASADMPLTYMLVLSQWRKGALGLGLLEGGLALGYVIGALVCQQVVSRLGRGNTILLGLVATGVSMFLIAVLPFWAAVIVNAVSGVFNVLFFVPSVTMNQELAPSASRARVLGSRSALISAAILASYVMATALTSSLEPALVLAALGGLLAAVTMLAAVARPILRTR
jgi:MFS family permease